MTLDNLTEYAVAQSSLKKLDSIIAIVKNEINNKVRVAVIDTSLLTSSKETYYRPFLVNPKKENKWCLGTWGQEKLKVTVNCRQVFRGKYPRSYHCDPGAEGRWGKSL